MFVKTFITIAIFAVLVATSCGQSHNIQWGQRTETDRLLWSGIEQKTSKVLQIVTKDVDFPAKGETNYATITYINVTDQYVNGNGGYATLLSGGVNNNHATIHLKSQRGHGFNFFVDVYGF